MPAGNSYQAPASAPAPLSKPQRLLSCVLCQQRKVKCNRQFPCSNCTRLGSNCVPATLNPRRKRRRYSERELLDRLRKYECLLRTHNIEFESLFETSDLQAGPFNSESHDNASQTPGDARASQDALSQSSDQSDVEYEAKSFWAAVNGFRNVETQCDSPSPVDARHDMIKKVWDKLSSPRGSTLFLGSHKQSSLNAANLHPEPAQIFRLWQIYLDNIDPLLKITHAPTLQGRIVQATGDITKVEGTFNALLFGIYCSAIYSISAVDCQAIFSVSKESLLATYQSACEYALQECNFLGTNDVDCLAAYFLYIVSLSRGIDPRALYSMLGAALRVGQRMQLHSETTDDKFGPLETERRRRLWWALVLFDGRLGELADYRPGALEPTWSCKPPLNVSDSDLRPGLKNMPVPQERPSEALFAVIRSEIADFVRYSAYHIALTTPSLKPLAKDTQRGVPPNKSGFSNLEKALHDKYLRFCDLENPLHLIAYWTAKGAIAKGRLTEYFSRLSKTSTKPTVAQLDSALTDSLTMLECDTKIIETPTTKGFRWLLDLYFPFPGYINICRDLAERISGDQAKNAWEVMGNNCEVRFTFFSKADELQFEVFARVILQAWDAYKAKHGGSEGSKETETIPKIVLQVQHRLAEIAATTDGPDNLQSMPQSGVEIGRPQPLMSTEPPQSSIVYRAADSLPFSGTPSMPFTPSMATVPPLNTVAGQMDWPTPYWTWGTYRGW